MSTASALLRENDNHHNERFVFVLQRTANKIVIRDYGVERTFHLREDTSRFECAEHPAWELVL